MRALLIGFAGVAVISAGLMGLSPYRSVHLQIRSSLLVSSVEGALRVHGWTSQKEKTNTSPPGLSLGKPPSPYEIVWWCRYRSGTGWWSVTVPMWMVALASGVPAAVLAYRAIKRRRAGRCQGCGYSLAGLRGEVCPECGGAAKRRN